MSGCIATCSRGGRWSFPAPVGRLGHAVYQLCCRAARLRLGVRSRRRRCCCRCCCSLAAIRHAVRRGGGCDAADRWLWEVDLLKASVLPELHVKLAVGVSAALPGKAADVMQRAPRHAWSRECVARGHSQEAHFAGDLRPLAARSKL